MSAKFEIAGGGGLKLGVREWGRKDGRAILLIHGFSQSHLSWSRQYTSTLADRFRLVTMDLRGHGESEKPHALENYTNGRLWAEDVAAVIEALRLERPIIVGWSYGGLVIGDYIRHFGDSALGGINFVGAAVKIGTADADKFIGAAILNALPGMVSKNLEENIAATRVLIRACTAQPLAQKDFELTLAYNMAVPHWVRLGLSVRKEDYEDALAKITVPTLVSHGTADPICLPAMGEYIVSRVRNAKKSFYDGVGHAPFIEDAPRFNRELAELAASVGS